jgi:hypothetical protein
MVPDFAQKDSGAGRKAARTQRQEPRVRESTAQYLKIAAMSLPSGMRVRSST